MAAQEATAQVGPVMVRLAERAEPAAPLEHLPHEVYTNYGRRLFLLMFGQR